VTDERVETLTRFYAAFNAGSGMEGFVELADPGFVYRTRPEFPDGGSYDIAGALERLAELRDMFEDIRWEPKEFIGAGERMVVVVRQTGRGRGSGAPIDQPVVHVWTQRPDGSATELSVYSSRDAALEAAGLGG
jgi:ketosteroid isomerase-like protein